MGQIYKAAKTLGNMKFAITKSVSAETRTRIFNVIENMASYPSVFTDLEQAVAHGICTDEWRAQVDAIIYGKMNDESAQKLSALIKTAYPGGQ